MLVRRDLHAALQYLLLEAMREIHGGPGPFNRLGEFPAEQPNDLPLSPMAQAFYRSGPTFWQQYTSFWLASLFSRILFFVVPIFAVLTPFMGMAPHVVRWLNLRQIDRLHRSLGRIERELAGRPDSLGVQSLQADLAGIQAAVRSLKVSRRYEVDLHQFRVHLRLVQEAIWEQACSTAPSAST